MEEPEVCPGDEPGVGHPWWDPGLAQAHSAEDGASAPLQLAEGK